MFRYEAGPCGFDPYRMLSGLGANCEVIAPTLILERRYPRVDWSARSTVCDILKREGMVTTRRADVPTPGTAGDRRHR